MARNRLSVRLRRMSLHPRNLIGERDKAEAEVEREAGCSSEEVEALHAILSKPCDDA